jgi:hypothetical protein
MQVAPGVEQPSGNMEQMAAHITEDITLLAFRCLGEGPNGRISDRGSFLRCVADKNFALYDHN